MNASCILYCMVTAVAGGSSSRDRGDGLMLMIILSTCIGAVMLLIGAILLTVCAYQRRLRSQLLNRHQGTTLPCTVCIYAHRPTSII